VIGVHTSYFAFIIPLALIGGGFVVATTVRTAIIFASVPRGLPRPRRAQRGLHRRRVPRRIVLVTAIVAQTAMAALDPLLAASLPASARLRAPRSRTC